MAYEHEFSWTVYCLILYSSTAWLIHVMGPWYGLKQRLLVVLWFVTSPISTPILAAVTGIAIIALELCDYFFEGQQ